MLLSPVPAGPGAPPRRYASVQGLRAMAMMLVFSFHLHYFIQSQCANPLSRLVVRTGGLGTDLFLCVAGCFIYRSLIDGRSGYAAFLAGRLRRLYPVYAFMLSLYAALDLLLGRGEIHGLGQLLANFLLLPVFLGGTPIMDASWTLAYILGFSAAAPLIVRPLRRLSSRWRVVALASFWLLALALGSSWGRFPLRVTLLAAGMLVWETLCWRFSTRIVLAAAAAGLALRLSPWSGAHLAGSLLLGPALLHLLLAHRASPGWLSSPVLQSLGDRSYSFYLAHGLPLLALVHYVFPRLSLVQLIALQPLWLLCSLAFAECVYRLVESPLSAARHARPEQPAAAPVGWLPDLSPLRRS
ncbi:MAG: acyltransferase [Candidatus Solibacter usitatus]|nr:acyltransferase [Candidatus Solibacter usitatus]